MRTTCSNPKTKLATLLFKAMRLSQASLELSSSRGVFSSRENERKRREKRAKQTLKRKAAGKIYINEKLLKVASGYKTMGVYIVHPKCENTRMPKILAYKRDKVVIHQNGVVWHQKYKKSQGQQFRYAGEFR